MCTEKETPSKSPKTHPCLPCSSRTWPGAGQGWPHPGSRPAEKKGILCLLSLLFLVKVGHALTSRALPCLETAPSRQKRKPQEREAGLSSGAGGAPERGTRGGRGFGEPGRAEDKGQRSPGVGQPG